MLYEWQTLPKAFQTRCCIVYERLVKRDYLCERAFIARFFLSPFAYRLLFE